MITTCREAFEIEKPMWVQMTPEEAAKWTKRAEKEARSHGLTVGAGAWVLATLVLSGGWIVSFRQGVAVQRSFFGTFWTRLPVFALLTLPFAYIAFRSERKKALREALGRTICPKCDIVGERNAGAACECGGLFLPHSTMKWVEQDSGDRTD